MTKRARSRRRVPVICLPWVLGLVLIPSTGSAQICPGECLNGCGVGCLNGCGVGSNQCPTVEEEFAGGFATVDEAGNDNLVMWDVDIAKRLTPNEGYHVVWEERTVRPDFITRYRVFLEDSASTGVESVPLCTGQTSSDVNVCTLGPGGNPEVFQGVVVWHDGDRENIHWIATADIEAGNCCHTNGSCHCVGQGAANDVDVSGLGPTWARKAAVTDGRVILWWECKSLNNKCGTSLDIDLYGCVIPAGGGGPRGCTDRLGVVPVAAGAGMQRRPRVIVDDVVQGGVTLSRSLVVYEDCPDSSCDDAQVMGVYIYPDQAPGDLTLITPPFLIADFPGLDQRWPDASGDLVVWDQEDTDPGTAGIKEIWGCQAPLDAQGNHQFERCNETDVNGKKPNIFRISDPGAPTVSHLRPTVWGPRNLVSWSMDPQSKDCHTQEDMLVARLERDPSTTQCRVRTHPDPDGSAFAWTVVLAQDVARQRAPRIGHSAVFWSDTRFTGCLNSDRCPADPDNIYRFNNNWVCDDAIGALLEDAHRDWYKPPLGQVSCQTTGTNDVRLTFELVNDLDLGVLGDLTLLATCQSQPPPPGGICPGPSPPPAAVQLTLAPGTNQHQLDFTCCLPIGSAQVDYFVEFEPACGKGTISYSGTVSCP